MVGPRWEGDVKPPVHPVAGIAAADDDVPLSQRLFQTLESSLKQLSTKFVAGALPISEVDEEAAAAKAAATAAAVPTENEKAAAAKAAKAAEAAQKSGASLLVMAVAAGEGAAAEQAVRTSAAAAASMPPEGKRGSPVARVGRATT